MESESDFQPFGDKCDECQTLIDSNADEDLHICEECDHLYQTGVCDHSHLTELDLKAKQIEDETGLALNFLRVNDLRYFLENYKYSNDDLFYVTDSMGNSANITKTQYLHILEYLENSISEIREQLQIFQTKIKVEEIKAVLREEPKEWKRLKERVYQKRAEKQEGE